MGDGRIDDTDPETLSTVVDSPVIKRRSELQRGATLGRYIVLGPIGRGGMGMVYKAYDPELDRRIALKLVVVARRVSSGERAAVARDRLLREAQALAQVSHPNVIAIHDVGTVDDDLFIAMELVDGQTLRQWLRARERGFAEITRLLLAAGRGLAAAHAAGLIHRDFKPDNLLVGSDGRPRVIDFGLARLAGPGDSGSDHDPELSGADTAEYDGPLPNSDDSARPGLDTPLTRAGSILGTPSYMAPEQHLGRTADARSDQFAFCVTLWRALFGVKPFSGDDVHELRETITAGAIDPPPAGHQVPRWLIRVLERGLSVDPALRFETMDELLDELERGLVVRRRRWISAASAVGALAATAAITAVLTTADAGTPPCSSGPDKIAAVWNDAVRDRLEAAMLATGSPHAKATYDIFTRRLDDYAAEWVDGYTTACRATRVLGEQSEALLDRRMACLTRRLHKLEALAGVIAAASTVDRAVPAARRLPAIADCANIERLATPVAPPEGAESVVGEIDAATEEADRVEAMLVAGEREAGRTAAAALVERVEPLGYPPLTAEALFLLGAAQRLSNQPEAAEKTLREATLAAAAARDDVLAARIWSELVFVVGYSEKKFDEGLALRAYAEPAAIRSGDPVSRANLLNNVGAILRRKGDYDGAEKALTEALEIWTERHGEHHLLVSRAHNNLGNVLTDMGRYEAARGHHEKVIEIRERELGHDHPDVASAYNNLGNTYLQVGEYEKARDVYNKALAIYEKLGPDSDDVTMVLNNLGNAMAELDELDEAESLQRRALAIQEARLKPDDPDLGISHNNLADLALKRERYDEAIAEYTRARDIWKAGLGAEHPYIGHATAGIGYAQLGAERFAEAKRSFIAALAIWRGAHSSDSHPVLAAALVGIGLSDLGLDRPAAAIAPLERAVAIRTENRSEPPALAEAQLGLAKAVWRARKDRTRAIDLATRARANFATTPAYEIRVPEIDEWLVSELR